ncbi:MAG: sigma-54 dependent transcriptional regulator [Bacteroidetes bacterium]|nr:sigma-54 dependent transcriptional regulator [Bacteroidota bacterium]
MKDHILIIDDEDKLRSLLARIVSLEDFSVNEASDLKSGLKKLSQEEYQVVICDVKLPDGNGIEVTQKIKSLHPFTEVIILTAFGDIHDGVQAMKNGAFDYLVKGDDNEKIIPLIYRASEKAKLHQRIHQLEKKVSTRYGFENILGSSKAIVEVTELAKKVAATDATVLLLGETGTGKEVFAQSIHYGGARGNKNFVAVNCAAISREILESELFGHRAGSFTGAVKDKKGLFEEANDGTIFLDEIGEMSLDLQTKLLRVLETNEYMMVGDTRPTKVNVRIIAATNLDLAKEADKGNFRSDLFYRLAVFQIHLPPLRERTEDIEIMADYFLNFFAAKVNKPAPKMSVPFLDKLKTYPWKGNIRELKNIMERTLIMSAHTVLAKEDLPADILHFQSSATGTFDLSSVEKQHILKVLSHTKGNKTEAARLMNIGLTTLYRKLEEYKIH